MRGPWKESPISWRGTLWVAVGLAVAALLGGEWAMAQGGRRAPGSIVANAGKDLENVGFNAPVKLDGSRSRPSKGGGALHFQWQQVSGVPVTLTGANTATPSFITPPPSGYLENYWYVEGPGIPGTPGVANRARRGPDLKIWRVIPFGRQHKVLEFDLTVTDDGGGRATDRVTVFIDPKEGVEVSTGQNVVPVGVRTFMSGATSEATGTDWVAGSAQPGTHRQGTNDRITGWKWTLTSRPPGSQVVLQDATSQTPFLIPDVEGEYQISFEITAVGDIPEDYLDVDNNGRRGGDGLITDTPEKLPPPLTLIAAKWVGVGTIGGRTAKFSEGHCGACHDQPVTTSDGGTLPAILEDWQGTGHATILQRGLNGLLGPAYQESCLPCHTLGFDKSRSARNGGWDDLARGFRFKKPAPGLFNRLLDRFPALAQRANVQCENCHGPGSQHVGDPEKISHTLDPRVCAQCHDAAPEGAIFQQWRNHRHGYDVHILAQQTSPLPGVDVCQRCHSSEGWLRAVIEGGDPIAIPSPNRIGCATCHDPHSAGKEHQLRRKGPEDMVELPDGSLVEGGKGTVCMTCHNLALTSIKNPKGVNGYIDAYLAGETKIPGTEIAISNTFIPPSSQMPTNTEMLAGTGGYEFTDEKYARSFHFENPDTCVTCHMFKTPAEGEPGHNRVGGHTFNVRTPAELVGVRHGEEAGERVENVAACQQCHPGLDRLNRRARGDYDGDGRVEGVQDEVAGLIALVRSAPGFSNTITRSSTLAQAAARWNVGFVERDISAGIHNTAYAVTLLQRSYKKLTGNEVPGASIVSKREAYKSSRRVLRLK